MYYCYSESDARVAFSKGLTRDQIEKISVWLRYSERYLESKFALAPPASAERESWRRELHAINEMQIHLRERILNGDVSGTNT